MLLKHLHSIDNVVRTNADYKSVKGCTIIEERRVEGTIELLLVLSDRICTTLSIISRTNFDPLESLNGYDHCH